MRKRAKKPRVKGNTPRPSARSIAKGREIIQSLDEVLTALRNGEPLSTRFIVRVLDLPNGPADPKAARAARDIQAE